MATDDRKFPPPATSLTASESCIMWLLPLSQLASWAGLAAAVAGGDTCLSAQAGVGGFFAGWALYNRCFSEYHKKLEL